MSDVKDKAIIETFKAQRNAALDTVAILKGDLTALQEQYNVLAAEYARTSAKLNELVQQNNSLIEANTELKMELETNPNLN